MKNVISYPVIFLDKFSLWIMDSSFVFILTDDYHYHGISNSDGPMINYNWKSVGLDSWTDDQAQSYSLQLIVCANFILLVRIWTLFGHHSPIHKFFFYSK